MKEPIWLTTARQYIGQKEIAGVKSNPWILSLWDSVSWIWGGKTPDDSIMPWCGAFVRAVMVESGIKPPSKWWSALAWASWGTNLHKPTLGAIGVMKRDGGAHVTIIVGKDNAGNILGLGGNQGDMVKISAFNPNRFVDYVWPAGQPVTFTPLPILSASLSTNEA